MGLVAYLSLSGSGREVGWGGRLFEAGRLLTFSASRMGAYWRWAIIQGWALIRINTVYTHPRNSGSDKIVRTYSRPALHVGGCSTCMPSY